MPLDLSHPSLAHAGSQTAEGSPEDMMSLDTAGEQPAKRSRTTFACRICRTKKLACSGSRPCTRCRADGYECTDESPSERTPLTRKRMTELEEKIADFERVWNPLYPTLSIDTVVATLSSVGLDATVKKIGNVQKYSNSVPAGFSEPASSPIEVFRASEHGNYAFLSSPQDPASGVAYPPTRPISPHDLSVRVADDINSGQAASTEWNEDRSRIGGSTRIAATPSKDFGTGVSAGAGYIGLSSGATLLRAIQKFAPNDLAPPRFGPERGLESSSSLTASGLFRPGRLSISPGNLDRPALELPPADEIGPLVDSYFRYFHALTPIVHEPTIRAQITGALPLPTGTGGCVLFNMIFATGAFDSATDDANGSDGLKYYEVARAALQQDMLENGSPLIVQGLAIMAIYLQRSNKPNAGYLCLGLAIRMAKALGVHTLGPRGTGSSLTILESEMRARIWWGLVTLEAGQSMTYGRPHSISLPSLSTVRLPTNTDDALLTISTTKLPLDVPRVTLYTALITQAKLAQMAFVSLDRVSRSLPSPTVEQIKWCGDFFRDQVAAFPAYMQPGASGPYSFARTVQIWRGRDYMSVLYRPVLLSAAWNTTRKEANDVVQEIVHTCRSLALQNLQEITEFVRNHMDVHRGSEWYTLYFGIQASLTILLSIVWEPHHPSATFWREHIMNAIVWFRQLESMKELGTAYAHILESALATTPNAQLFATNNQHTCSDQLHRDFISEPDNYDFERYFSEIWDGQTQVAGMTADFSLGVEPEMWENFGGGIGG